MLVFYKLNSAIERGTKPDALGCKPCHCTSTLKAARVNASRPRSRRRPPYTLLAYPPARRGGLRGAGGISTEARIAVNIDRGFCPKNRSAAVVPSVRVRKKLCTAVRQARFLGRSSPRS